MNPQESLAFKGFLKTLDWTAPYVELYDEVEAWFLDNTSLPVDDRLWERIETLVSARLR